jgi:hypothetical protein
VAAYCELDVELVGVEPRIWRRILVTADASLWNLEEAIAAASGWGGFQPAFFHVDERATHIVAGMVFDEHSEIPVSAVADPYDVPLARWLADDGTSLYYTYGCSREWVLRVVRRATVVRNGLVTRLLVDGERAFPPEVCHNVGEYRMCAGFARTGHLPDGMRPELVKQLGTWAPEAFDLKAARDEFDRRGVNVIGPDWMRPRSERESLDEFWRALSQRDVGAFERSVVRAALARSSRTPWRSVVTCVGSSPGSICRAPLDVWIDARTSQAVWRCARCGRGGVVTDGSGGRIVLPDVDEDRADEAKVSIDVDRACYGELCALEYPFGEVMDLLYAAQSVNGHITIAGSVSRMELLLMFVEDHACDAEGPRLDRLERVADRLGEAL